MASAIVAPATSSSSASSIAMSDTRTVAASSQTAASSSSTNELSQAIYPNDSAQYLSQTQDKSQSQAAAPIDKETPAKSHTPLPPELRRILFEVAKSGACSWMSWDGKDTSMSASSTTGDSSKSSLTMIRQPFSTHRRSSSFPHSGSTASQGPPRKKHRVGGLALKPKGARLHKSSGTGKKRPLILIRTNSNANTSFSTPGSVGSGRTSGSEPDDSTQYEYDSEATSATTNSEVSVDRLRNFFLSTQNKLGSVGSFADDTSVSQQYKTLQEAFRVAIGLVLDHSYRHCGGYKLSPAEKRRNEKMSDKGIDEKRKILSSEDIFQQRRLRLLNMLQPVSGNVENSSRRLKVTPIDGPPFTIQRIAEVLVSPERYYSQTHKLCNCLEKLLLVRSSTGAFGGSRGGDTSQSRREDVELAALADEKGRQETELRQRRLRRRTLSSSPLDDMIVDKSPKSAGLVKKEESMSDSRKSPIREKKTESDDGDVLMASQNNDTGISEESSREMLESAARASLRTKFDHVGIDPRLSPDRDVLAIAENRRITNSPPPPSLAMSAATSKIALSGHSGVGVAGFVKQHLPEQNGDQHITRVPSPVLFSAGNDSQMHATANMHMLQLHHAVALTGASLSRGTSSPLDLMTIDAGSAAVGRSADGADLEAEHGRSSASNSDVDSESDELSFDDSASDRSDGSDSGSFTQYEPFTAARAMALNRMQQQQRLQSRVLTSLNSLHQSEGFRPPADSEYQSGDSIDSTRAEDSGESDSSSSDLAD